MQWFPGNPAGTELLREDNTDMAYNVWIRGLSGRGFRVKNAGGTIVTCKEGVNVQVDLENVQTREILSRERDNFVRVANNSDATPLLRGLSRRGFRIKNQAGATAQVKQGAATEVDMAIGATNRTLKRAKRDFIYVGPSDADFVNVYGLQESQASFRTVNPSATFVFAGANNDLTFAPTLAAPTDLTIELADLGVDNLTTDIINTSGNNWQISLAVTQAVAASATLSSDGTAPTDTDTVTVANRTYRFMGTPAQAFDVDSGASSDDALDNLVKAINGTGTAGVEYFAGTLPATGVTSAARTGTGVTGAITVTADTAGTAGNSIPKAEASTHLAWDGGGGGTAFSGGVDYSIDATAADVQTAVQGDSPGLDDLVTVTYEGTGLGLVGTAPVTALAGSEPQTLSKGSVIEVDVSDTFNIAQLRRHFRAWVEA